MMFLCTIIVVITTLPINGLSTLPGFNNHFILQGQVINPGGSQISIPPQSQLIIELQDISVTDQLADTIAQQIIPAVVFPIIFNLTYKSNQIKYQHLHVLNAKIIDTDNGILFTNKKRLEVKLLGPGRTTFIDVPVVSSRQHDLTPTIKLLEWPELVGKNGDEVVEIIKKDTGFEEVFVVTDGTKVTKDLRYDRVCVYVDQDGKVAEVPRTG